MDLQKKIDRVLDKRVPVWLPYLGACAVYFQMGMILLQGKMIAAFTFSPFYFPAIILSLLFMQSERYVRYKARFDPRTVYAWALLAGYGLALVIELKLGYSVRDNVWRVILATLFATVAMPLGVILRRRFANKSIKGFRNKDVFK